MCIFPLISSTIEAIVLILHLSSGRIRPGPKCVAISADGSKVVVPYFVDNEVKIFSTETGQVLQTLSGEHGLMHILSTCVYVVVCVYVCMYVYIYICKICGNAFYIDINNSIICNYS